MGIPKFIFTIFLSGLLLFAVNCSASAAVPGRDGEKSLSLWGQEVRYRLTHEHNARLSYDGKALAPSEARGHFNQVVLNVAFLKPEAEDLFNRMWRAGISFPRGGGPLLPKGISRLEKRLLQGRSLSPRDYKNLHQIKESLEWSAWAGVFQGCAGQFPEREKAQACFLENFSRIRLEAIEYHEVSHLLDLSRKKNIRNTGEFGRDSELNAFFTELAYGANPLDVMAQALAGCLEEARLGKGVDDSTLKLQKVLGFLAKKPHGVPGGVLIGLAETPRADFVAVGRGLYSPIPSSPTASLASLR